MSDDFQSASVYAGRWVARLRGRIIAQGGTPDQALHAAQMSRHKERPEIIFMSLPFSKSPLLDQVRDTLPEQEIYLVGGAVRDMYLKRFSRDLDFAVPANGISLARRVANALQANFMALDQERDTGRVIVIESSGERTYLDFATFRGESLEADLRARDFTINAIAYDLKNGTVLDPLDGASDIRSKIIRICSESSISDDPVRILRAVRQAAVFDFKIDIETRHAMMNAAGFLPNVSPERQRDELFKILEGPKPEASLRALEMLNVFPNMMPELSAMKGVEQSLPHVHEVWEHTLKVLGYLEGILAALSPDFNPEDSKDPFTQMLAGQLGKYREHFKIHFAESLNTDRSVRALLFFAALYHDVEKPATKTVDAKGRIRFFEHDIRGAEVAARRGRTFNLSNDELDRLKKIIFNHMRFHFFTSQWEGKQRGPSRKSIYRFFRDSGEAGVDLILLGLADLQATRDHTLTQEGWKAALHISQIFLENYWEKREEVISPPLLLDGNELMKELNLEPGRIVGQLLEAIREEQAVGRIGTREQAIAFAHNWLSEYRKSEIENRKSP
ncbi:MAG TPA: HD domain-containing protein [Anaerolineales bacterium]|nr:HD domain-containing protein [Anaerolineales bacterium]